MGVSRCWMDPSINFQVTVTSSLKLSLQEKTNCILIPPWTAVSAELDLSPRSCFQSINICDFLPGVFARDLISEWEKQRENKTKLSSVHCNVINLPISLLLLLVRKPLPIYPGDTEVGLCSVSFNMNYIWVCWCWISLQCQSSTLQVGGYEVCRI